MKVTRRKFLQVSGAATVLVLAGMPGVDVSKVYAYSAKSGKLAGTSESTSICPYCGVGCGLIVASRMQGGKLKVINIEGDPDHPINEGATCSKGSAIFQIANNPPKARLDKVEYRAPGSNKFKQVTWDWALKEIAKRVKKTRDGSWKAHNDKGQTINRTEAIACLGGAALDNEECYVLSKFMRSLGVVYLEHQARI